MKNMKPEIFKHFRVIKAYESPYPRASEFPKGSHVKVVKEYQDDPQWPNWFWCVGPDNTAAWVPGQFLQLDGKKGILIRDYNAIELSVQVEEKLQVYEVINGFGWAQNSEGNYGWVPMKHLVQDTEKKPMSVEFQIESERLQFRQLTSLDASDLGAFFSDDESMRYIQFKRDRDGVHEWLKLVQESYCVQGYGPWALVHKSSKQFLGYCGLYKQEDVDGRDEVELLYGILRQYWGEGYASEAAHAVLVYAKNDLGLNRCISLIAPENVASIKVAGKVGMCLEKKVGRWSSTYGMFAIDLIG